VRNVWNTSKNSKNPFIWIGTRGSGIIRFNYFDKSHKVFTTEDGLSDNVVLTITQLKDGTVVAGTENGGLCFLKSEEISCIDTSKGLPSNTVHFIYRDEKDYIWAATESKQLIRLEGKKIISVVTLPSMPTKIIIDSRQRIWIGTLKDGVYLFNHLKGLQPVHADVLGKSMVSSLYEDNHGSIWVGTVAEGLFRLRELGHETILTGDNIAIPNVIAMMEDEEGSLWLGTRGSGLRRLKAEKRKFFRDYRLFFWPGQSWKPGNR